MSRLMSYRETVLNAGYRFTEARIFHTAFELDLFERLRGGAKTARTLAEELKADVCSLELFLNTLVSLGYLASEGSSYQNTKYGRELFVKGTPLYIGDYVALQMRSSADWFRLKESIFSGKSLDPVQSFQEFDEERTAAFARAMHSTAMGHAQFLSRKLALKSAKTLLDMGGGPGTFTIHFLKENAELRATVFDLPETLKTTRKFVAAAKLEDRVSYQEGDFNETKLQGAFDVCFLSHIIHGQDELKNKALFKKIYAALNSGGRFIVQDFFLNRDRQSPQFSAVFALHMLLYTDRGRTYSFEETTSWLEETGFTNVKPLNLHLPRSIGLISAEKS